MQSQGGAEVSDGEEIVETYDTEGKRSVTDNTPSEPITANLEKASKKPNIEIELQASRLPYAGQAENGTPGKSILKEERYFERQRSTPPASKRLKTVSFNSKSSLFKKPEDAEEYDSFKNTGLDEENEFGGQDGGWGSENQRNIQAKSNNQESNEQAPASFYDTLFSTAYLKVAFRKYKQPLMEKYPNGYDLEKLEVEDLEETISSRPHRKRILTEAKKLIEEFRETPGGYDTDGEEDLDFLGAPAETESDDESENAPLY